MKGIECIAADRIGTEAFKQMDMATYTARNFFMFGGEVRNLTLEFSNHLIDVVIDRFGKNITTRKTDAEHFQVCVDVAVSEQFFGWMFGLGLGAKVIAPKEVAEQMKKMLEDVGMMYHRQD